MLTDHYSTHVYIYSLYQKCFHIKSAASKVLASISDANWWCYAPMHTQLYLYHSVRLGSDSVTFSCCGGSWRSCTASPTPLFPCQPLSRPSTLVSQVYLVYARWNLSTLWRQVRPKNAAHCCLVLVLSSPWATKMTHCTTEYSAFNSLHANFVRWLSVGRSPLWLGLAPISVYTYKTKCYSDVYIIIVYAYMACLDAISCGQVFRLH